jgi:hypothetical protein
MRMYIGKVVCYSLVLDTARNYTWHSQVWIVQFSLPRSRGGDEGMGERVSLYDSEWEGEKIWIKIRNHRPLRCKILD